MSMEKIVNGLKRISKSFTLGRKKRSKEHKNTHRDVNSNEECKKSPVELSPAEFNKQIDEDLAEFNLTRVDSNGFVNGSARPRAHIPSRSGKSTKYFLKDKIGEGQYGKVYRSIDVQANKEYAIKISKLTADNRKYLLDELDLLRKLQSPYIVSVYEGFVVGNKLWLVMEHCIGGSILDVMKLTKKETLSEPLMKGVIGSLLLALDFLHGHRIIHRDVKASNLVLTMGGQIKLIDFGISTEIKSGEICKRTVIGSPYWMAPEVIEGRDYDEKVDIWSLGMTILELCEPKHPLFCIHPVSVLFKIVTADPPYLHKSCTKRYSLEFNHFFTRCVQKDPKQRLSSKELLDHLWIQSTVSTLVRTTDNNSSTVAALEQLFMQYVMHDELAILTWDEEDEREALQQSEGGENENEDEGEGEDSTGGERPPSSLRLSSSSSSHSPPPPSSSSTCSGSSSLLLSLQEHVDLENLSDTSTLPSPLHEQHEEHKQISPTKLENISPKKRAVPSIFTPEYSQASERSLVTRDIFSDSPLTSPTRHPTHPTPYRSRSQGFHKRVSFSSDTSQSSLSSPPPDSPSLQNSHSHPNSLNSKPPSLLATPPSLRHQSSQSYIQRVLISEGLHKPPTTSYRSLGSFEQGSYILASKRGSPQKSTHKGSSGGSNDKIFSSSRNDDEPRSSGTIESTGDKALEEFDHSSSFSACSSFSYPAVSSSEYYSDI